MAEVLVLAGPGSSARSREVDRRVLGCWGRGLLVLPGKAMVGVRRERLILEGGLRGGWGRPVTDFRAFAECLLREEGIPVRLLTAVEQRGYIVETLSRLDLKASRFAASLESPGYVAHLLRVIVALKQAAIEPEEFRTRLGGQAGKWEQADALIAAVYSGYQALLHAEAVYDVPGLYWAADLVCRERRPRLLEGIDHFFLDGFDDFTPSEFRLLGGVERHVREMVFGLNHDTMPDRQDLYELPRATLEQIQRRFTVRVIKCEAFPPASQSAFAARHLFWRDRPGSPENLRANLRLVPCADVQHEAETIGREIKRLLVDDGVAMERIAVVFPSLSGVAETVQSAFAAFQIPLRMSWRPALSQSAVGALLRRFFEAIDTWEREAVVAVLASPVFDLGGATPEQRLKAHALACAAGISTGYDAWKPRLDALSRSLAREGASARQYLPGISAAAARLGIPPLLDAVNSLHEIAATLPAEASARVFSERLDAVLTQLGMDTAVAAIDESGLREAESNALRALRTLLETLADAPESEAAMPWQAFRANVEHVLAESDYALPGNTEGVACLEAEAVRGLAFDHVYFGGLNEGQLPAPRRQNAIYSEFDLVRLRDRGIDLEGRGVHAARERLRFHHVIECATEQLTLSWRLMEGGREAAISPFLAEVSEMFPEGDGVHAEMPLADSWLPTPETAASISDLKRAGHAAFPALRDCFPEHFVDLEAPVAIEHARHDASTFGAYDGVVADAALLEALSTRFGATHHFSTSQLECYLDCPFRFFTENVLRVREVTLPEFGLDPMLIGALVHEVLRRFHARHAGVSAAEIDAEEGGALIDVLTGEVFAAGISEPAPVPPGILEVERRRMALLLRRYLLREAEKGSDWKPMHFEVAFGRAGGAQKDPPSCEAPFRMATNAGNILLSGRIDRIDLKEGDLACIIDYKTGGLPAAGEIALGTKLQLSLYAAAVEGLILPGSRCAEAQYVKVGSKETRDGLKGNEKKYGGRAENVAARVAEAVQGVRSGQFPPIRRSKTCHGCGMAHACRYERARIERKRPDLKEMEEEES